MLRISILLQSVASVRALSTSQSRLQHALDRLNRNPSVDACLDVIRQVPGAAPVDAARLRALAVDEEEDDAALSTRFFAAKPCDDAVRALARGEPEAAAAVSASGRFALLPRGEADAVLDALDAVIASEATLAARRAALDDTRRDGLTDAPSASDDERLASALASTLASALAPVLRPRGFPESPLGTRSFVAAAGPRAAAAIGRVWHASDGLAPLVAPAASGDTLVVAFSSLGWHGLLRAEWRGVLRAIGRRNVAHALDTAKTWYCSNPMTGHFDDGAWWDATLAELCKPYQKVVLLGDSMGGTAALRFARHADAVVAFVPQIDLRSFPAPCDRVDFDDARREQLRDDIVNAVDASDARISIHVGRDADDLQQLTYLPRAVAAYAADEDAGDVDEPLPRDGETVSQVVDDGNGFRVVKHDVEGHAIATALKRRGILEEALLASLV
jgi:hypothetical protein